MQQLSLRRLSEWLQLLYDLPTLNLRFPTQEFHAQPDWFYRIPKLVRWVLEQLSRRQPLQCHRDAYNLRASLQGLWHEIGPDHRRQLPLWNAVSQWNCTRRSYFLRWPLFSRQEPGRRRQLPCQAVRRSNQQCCQLLPRHQFCQEVRHRSGRHSSQSQDRLPVSRLLLQPKFRHRFPGSCD